MNQAMEYFCSKRQKMKLTQNELLHIAVRRYCDKTNTTYERFAEMMGISRQYLSNLTGKRPIPPEHIKRAAAIIGIDIAELTESTPETVGELKDALNKKAQQIEEILREKEIAEKDRQMYRDLLDMVTRQSKKD